MTVTIHRNPDCGRSRNILVTIRLSGTEPTIVERLKTLPIVQLSFA